LLLISFMSILSLRDKFENDMNFNEGPENLKMSETEKNKMTFTS
jgi:hypothetical protein